MALTASSTGTLVDDFVIRYVKETGQQSASNFCVSHFFQQRNAPLYFFTVEGARLLRTTVRSVVATAISVKPSQCILHMHVRYYTSGPNAM